MFEKWYAQQLRCPTGLFGLWVARRMNSINTEASRVTVELLNPQANHSVLEIGFGGGETLSRLLEVVSDGFVSGTEISETMLKTARGRFESSIRSGRLVLEYGNVDEQLPYDDNSFDSVCTLNTIYYWKHPAETFAELCRVVRPGGKIVVEFNPEETFSEVSFTQHGFTLYSRQKVEAFMASAGLQDIQFAEGQDIDGGFVVASALKPA